MISFVQHVFKKMKKIKCQNISRCLCFNRNRRSVLGVQRPESSVQGPAFNSCVQSPEIPVSPLKIMANIFYSTLKALFNLKIFKFLFMIEYNTRNIFVKKSYAKCAGESIPRRLSKKKVEHISGLIV